MHGKMHSMHLYLRIKTLLSVSDAAGWNQHFSVLQGLPRGTQV